METKARREQVKFWRVPEFCNLELLRATYITHSFTRHAHETFTIAVIERGAEEFAYRGGTHVAPAGSIAVLNPGEVHTGHAANNTGWTYRVLYPAISILHQAASVATQRRQELPYFPRAIIQDEQLAKLFLRLHQTLEISTSRLEQDSWLLWTLAHLITRHAGDCPTLLSIGKECQSIKRVREYLEAHYSENTSLEQIAAVANLSPFYLIRTFRNQVGLPPHSYLNQVRIARAKMLLSEGLSIARVAHETGFADQSHLTRHFKRIVGATPGQYRLKSNNVQD